MSLQFASVPKKGKIHPKRFAYSNKFRTFAARFLGIMDKKNKFLIPVSSLALGSHSFDYEIDNDFFQKKDYSEVRQGEVSVKLDVDRQETMLRLHFDLKGSVRVPCDRCADEFDQPIESQQDFFLKLGTENAQESDEVAVVSPDLNEYDVRPLMYEYIILAIPMHRVHPEGQCNPEVLAILNQEVAEVEASDTIDPRWAALKDIDLNDKLTIGN